MRLRIQVAFPALIISALTVPHSVGIAQTQVPKRPMIAYQNVVFGVWISNVWLMNEDGTDKRLLTEGGTATWSPDGQRIAFVHKNAIFTIRWDGTDKQLVRAFAGNTSLGTVAWSPDGAQLAFFLLPNREKGGGDIYVINVDGSNLRNITQAPDDNFSLSWSPGYRIAYSTHMDEDVGIWTINADGTDRRRVIGGGWEGYVFDPEHDHWLVNDRNAVRIDYYMYPRWLANRRQIAFTHERMKWERRMVDGVLIEVPDSPFRIGVVDATGGEPTILTTTNDRQWTIAGFSWSSDGKRFVFARRHEGDAAFYDIYLYDLEQGRETMLTNDRGSDWPALFDPAPYAVSPSGKLSTTWGTLKVGRGAPTP